MTTRLAVLYRDERMIAAHKPAGMLVHRTDLARHAKQFVLQLLRDQIGKRVYPLHLLDRATAGVLVFALDPYQAKRLSETLHAAARKDYRATVCGWTPAQGVIDHAIGKGDTDPNAKAISVK